MKVHFKQLLTGLMLGAAGALALFGSLNTCDGRDPAWKDEPPVVLGEELNDVLRDAGVDVVEEVSP